MALRSSVYDGSKQTVPGKELANWTIKLPEPRSFSLFVYKKK